MIELKEGFKEMESLLLVQRRERGSKEVHSRVDKKEIYLTVKVTTDYTSILCKKKDRKKRMV